MKKIRCVLLCLLLAAGSALSCGAVSTIVSGAEWHGEDIDVSVKIGYSCESFYCGKWLPVYVTMYNHSTSNVSGSFELKIDHFNYYSYGSNPADAWEKDYSLAADTEKTIVIPVYLYNSGSSFTWTVKNERGRTLYSANSYATWLGNGSYYGKTSDVLLVGYICEETGAENAFDDLSKLMTASSGTSVAVEKLTPDYFPLSEAMISSFDIICVDSIDTSSSSSFTKEQLQLLDYYMQSGHPVVFGTGSKKGSSLKGFEEYLASGSSAVKALEKHGYCTVSYTDYFSASVNYTGFNDGCTLCSVEDANFTPVLDGSTQLPAMYKHESLPLYIAAYGFDSYAGVTGNSLSLLTLDCIISDNTALYQYVMSNTTQTDGTFISLDAKDRSPSGVVILVFMGAYIGIAVIGAYIFLRRKKKERYMWVTLPAFVIIFSLAFLAYGAVIKGGNAVNSVNYVKLGSDGRSLSEIQSSVYVASGGSYRITYGYDGAVYFSSGAAGDISADDSKDYTQVSYGRDSGYTVIATKDDQFYTACTYTDTSYGPLDCSLTAADGSYTIRVGNTTGRDLTGCTVYYWGTAFYLGDIKAGESFEKEFSASGTVSYEDLVYNLCYLPAGISEKAFNSDYLQNRVYETKVNPISGYTIYNYSNYYSDWQLFASLKKSDSAYRRAMLLKSAWKYYENASYSAAYFTAFDESAEVSVMLNGREAKNSASQTFVSSTVSISGDGSVPFSADDISVSVAAHYEYYLPEEGGGMLFETAANDGNSGNWFVYLLAIPHSMRSSGQEISIVFEYPDEKAEDYFALYVLDTDTYEFTETARGGVLSLPLYGSSCIITNGENYSYYDTGYYSYISNGALGRNSIFFQTVLKSAFGTDKSVYVDDYGDFADKDIIAIAVDCDGEKLRELYGDGATVKAPVISSVRVDGKEFWNASEN